MLWSVSLPVSFLFQPRFNFSLLLSHISFSFPVSVLFHSHKLLTVFPLFCFISRFVPVSPLFQFSLPCLHIQFHSLFRFVSLPSVIINVSSFLLHFSFRPCFTDVSVSFPCLHTQINFPVSVLFHSYKLLAVFLRFLLFCFTSRFFPASPLFHFLPALFLFPCFSCFTLLLSTIISVLC